MNNKVELALLHAPLHTPETGALGPKLTSYKDAQNKAVKMEDTDDGKFLVVWAPVPSNPKKLVKIIVPMSNVVYYVRDEKSS